MSQVIDRDDVSAEPSQGLSQDTIPRIRSIVVTEVTHPESFQRHPVIIPDASPAHSCPRHVSLLLRSIKLPRRAEHPVQSLPEDRWPFKCEHSTTSCLLP